MGSSVCALWVLCAVRQRSMRRADHSSYRVWCVWVWSWSHDNKDALAHWRGAVVPWGGTAPLILNLSGRRTWVEGPTPRLFNPVERTPSNILIRDCVGARIGLRILGREKYLPCVNRTRKILARQLRKFISQYLFKNRFNKFIYHIF